MTQNHLTKNVKLKAIFTLLLILMLSFSVFFITACDSDEEAEETTYTKVESDSSDIVNGSFEFGTADTDISDLPKTSSVTGWGSASAENSAKSSNVSSGIINTDDNAWEKLSEKLYANSTFKSKMNAVYGIDAENKSESEVVAELKTKNPSVHDGANGKKIYMLNAYTSSADSKNAVTVSSSSSVALKKGTFAKISFWVFTQYAGDGYKINFRLKNTFNSSSQAQYILSGIGSNSWQQYTVYIKADKEFDSTVTPVMSIGYTSLKTIESDCSEGTAFFDDIVYTELTETEFSEQIAAVAPENVKNLEYGAKANNLTQSAADSVYKYVYDMTLNTPVSYFNDVDFLNNDSKIQITNAFTGVSETSYTKFGEESKYNVPVRTADSVKIDGIEHASVSVKLEDVTVGNDYFTVEKESYLLLTFDVKNNLDKSGSTDITFLVYDEDDNENNVITYTNTDETEKGYITIVNNDHDVSAPAYKTFYIVIVVGPTDVKGTDSMYDFASGDVELSDFKFATGKIYQYEKDAAGNIIRDPEKHETANYKFYSLFSSVAASVSIDNHVHEDTDTYYLSAAKSSGGGINYNPVAVVNYEGVSYESNRVKKDGKDESESPVNGRTGNQGDGNGNYAGLINSKVANDATNNYETVLSGIKAALNYSGEKSIQPIMIYNNTADSYGFIGKSFNVSASAYAAISVKVRVVGGAKASVYLIDASDLNKNVYSVSFTGNVKGNSYNETFTAPLCFTNITADDMDADGWTTVTFYIATGATALDLRLELWNGERTGENKSQGFVFFAFDAFSDAETFTPSTLSSAFTEPSSVAAAFTESGNPLYGDNALRDNNIKYQRELDATEIKYNKENSDSAVSYDPTYVWAKSDKVIYAVLNTIDPVAVDPYASEEEETESGCTAESDPSTFWLSFSSILLGVALFIALTMLIVKNVLRRKKLDKNDAKSHYNVSSRTSAKKKADKTPKATKATESKFGGYEDENAQDTAAENEQTADNTSESGEQPADDYVYGDVQDFGESETDSVDSKENVSDNSDNTEENKD